jgi:glycosyltransferase involved in cell wall biosynthesis
MESGGSSMKLVVLTNILTPYRIPLYEALQSRVDDFTVLLMAEREENREWRLPSYRFKTEVLPGVHLRPPGYEVSLHINYGVIRVLRRLNPDVVLSGGFAPGNLSALLYCKFFRKKYVGWGELTLKERVDLSWSRKLIRKWITTLSDGSVASSSEAREVFQHYGARPQQILISLMPIEVNSFHEKTMQFRRSSNYELFRSNYSKPILLSVGRITRNKGYRELFNIYQHILHVWPEASLVIVGNGPDRPSCEEEVRKKAWSNVHFIGFLQSNELAPYFSIADVFVFPTLFDHFGAVLSEAMASELPVASSVYAAGTHDLIEEGVTGFRIDPKNAEMSAAAILKILEMKPEERRVLGKRAYERVERCDVEISADEILSFLGSVVHSQGHLNNIPKVNTIERVHEKHNQ